MDNEQLLPFERNRFYTGKLLTSSDFQAEQNYLNNKRRFINSIMFGSGVVRGLDVYNLDDISVIIEPGAAIDGRGREIAVDNAIIRKLSAIDGFDSIGGDRALLMLNYNEEAVHPTYSVVRNERSDPEYEMNHVREGWSLFLTEPSEITDTAAGGEFLSSAVLYSDSDFIITLAMPGSVSCGKNVKLVLTMEKLSGQPKRLSADCMVNTPAFSNEEGRPEFFIGLEGIELEKGETLRRVYTLKAQERPAPETLLLAKSGAVSISVDGERKQSNNDLTLKVNVLDVPLTDLIGREVGRFNPDAIQNVDEKSAVCLAEFTLQRNKNDDYIVEKIENRKSYIRTMAAEKLRGEYLSYFDIHQENLRISENSDGGITAEPLPLREPFYATGICEIPLGGDTRKGDIVYSDEIMHGLGSGNIYVNAGFEYIREEGRGKTPEKHAIFGNAELFHRDDPPVASADVAVKVHSERGSFVVAARLSEPTSYATLSMRWVAIKLPSGDDALAQRKTAGMSIAALTPTAVLGIRDTHYFAVTYKNMEPCTLSYELTEKNSGEISPDGVYTAPAREGIYEIRISCVDIPFITTYAYAVVKKDYSSEEE